MIDVLNSLSICFLLFLAQNCAIELTTLVNMSFQRFGGLFLLTTQSIFPDNPSTGPLLLHVCEHRGTRIFHINTHQEVYSSVLLEKIFSSPSL